MSKYWIEHPWYSWTCSTGDTRLAAIEAAERARAAEIKCLQARIEEVRSMPLVVRDGSEPWKPEDPE